MRAVIDLDSSATRLQKTALIMAAGTGGHIFPALAIAHRLVATDVNVEWLGTAAGLENRLLSGTGFRLHKIQVSGLVGSGLRRQLLAPVMIARAYWQSLTLLRRVRPGCVLGMGGFVCGPAGLACRSLGIPLLIHEQNAVAGLTNRLLARLANRVLTAFPKTVPRLRKAEFVGNPVRPEIVEVGGQTRDSRESGPLRLLILGGSQGAQAINQLIPELLADWQGEVPCVTHQTGASQFDAVRQHYRELDIDLDDQCRVVPFIDDMAAVYAWADLVISRSGASTVSEIAAAGLPSILIPYPHHRDRQQVLNGKWLADEQAAFMIEQSALSKASLGALIHDLDSNRAALATMSRAARGLAVVNAADRIAEVCREMLYD